MNFEQRRNALRRTLNQMVADDELITPEGVAVGHCDGVVVMAESSIRYYSGFSGSNGLLWLDMGNPLNDILFTDSRYTEQAKQQCGDLSVVITSARKGAVLQTLDPLPSCIAVEGCALSWPDYEKIDELLHGPQLVDVSEVVKRQRSIKDNSEIEQLAAAADCAEKALIELIDSDYLRPGVTERSVAAQLDFLMRTLGSEGPSFDTIVATGANGALPHHEPDDTVLQDGDLVVIDFGATVNGYRSDCTRSFCLGNLQPWQEEIADVVLHAHMAAVEAVKSGCAAGVVDKAARDVIADAGYGDMFGHSTGHGVGLDVHENPFVRTGSTEILGPGSVFTVEPGIYIPNKGGIRIENTYALMNDDAVQSFQRYSLKVQVV